jgi:integrase
MKLTDKSVDALPIPAAGNKRYADSEIPGFTVVITMAGQRSFALRYRVRGRQRLYTIGSRPTWSTPAARHRAKELRRLVDQSIDPHEQEAKRSAPVVSDLCARYIADYLPHRRPSSQREYRSMIRQDILPAIGKIPVDDVRFGDVEQLHRKITRRAPTRANRVIALLSSLFGLSVKWGWRSDNPVRGIERNHEEPRQRFLSPSEIARLALALDASPERTSVALIKFLLLTGARYGEAAAATWNQIDIENGVWTKPSAHTKQRRTHRVPLSAPALALLSGLPRTGPLLFPGPTGKPIVTVKTLWRRVTRRAEIEDARIHDLRHSFASVLASAGLSLPIIGALLGHTQVATTQRYAHLLDDPLRQATERAGAVITGGASAEVVPMRRGGHRNG